MWQIIANIGSVAFLVFAILAIVALFRDRSKAKRYGLLSLAGFLLVGVAVSFDPSVGKHEPKAHPAAEERAAPAAKPKQAERPQYVEITAPALFNDYQSNEVAADNAYKGRVLVVAGEVDGIAKDFMGNVVIDLTTSNQFMPVKAYLVDEHEQRAAGLLPGHVVAVQCKGGGAVMASPILRDCQLLD